MDIQVAKETKTRQLRLQSIKREKKCTEGRNIIVNYKLKIRALNSYTCLYFYGFITVTLVK